MKNGLVLMAFGLLMVILATTDRAQAGPYYEENDERMIPAEDPSLTVSDADYSENAIDDLLRAVQQKRACVRRNGNCDHRPNDCCFSSSCRCNLWGSNCRCQRVGLFQKWG